MNLLYPDIASYPLKISEGNLVLRYYLTMISDGKFLSPGEFSAAVKYKMDYY